MHYKVLYHEPQNVIDYAKWLNSYHEDGLSVVAVNGPYHICVASQPAVQADAGPSRRPKNPAK